MQIIGITGRSGAGKNTAAGMLAAALCDIGFMVKIDSFGLPIKAKLRTEDGGYDKKRDRRLMQHISSALRDQIKECFVYDLANRNGIACEYPTCDQASQKPVAKQADFLIIPDVRYANEAAFCRTHGVLVLIQGSHEPLEGAEAKHESEAMASGMARSDVDHVIPKQPSLAKLARAIEEFVAAGLFRREETDNA